MVVAPRAFDASHHAGARRVASSACGDLKRLFSSVWLQKLSIAINSVSSTAALQRAPLFTRLTVLGESGEGDESGDWVGVRLADGG